MIYRYNVSQGTENTTGTVSVVLPVSSNSPGAFFGIYDASGDHLTAATIDGGAMTLVNKQVVNGGPFIYLYYKQNPTQASSTLTATRSTTGSKFNAIGASVVGVDTTTLISATTSGSTSGATFQITFNAPQNSWFVAMVANDTAAQSGTILTINPTGTRLDTLGTNYGLFFGGPLPSSNSMAFTVNGNTGPAAPGAVVGVMNPHLPGNVANAPRVFGTGDGISRGIDLAT